MFVTMGMMIPGRSCSAEGVVRRAAVAVSSLVLGVARPRFFSVDVAWESDIINDLVVIMLMVSVKVVLK